MTTLGSRASSLTQCVNLPGFFYTPGNSTEGLEPIATPCPADSWGPGLRKQRSCVACYPGFTTGGVTGATSPSACYVVAGYYVPPGSGGVAMACPQGTFKSEPGATTNCTACPGGTTTVADGSTSLQNCTIVMPSFYPVAMDGTAVMTVRRCPQRFYCPGGQPLSAIAPASLDSLDAAEPTIKACPNGTWTLGLEAASEQECLTPPGFFTANGNTSQCPPGSFRGEWVPAEAAPGCFSCGEGVFSSWTDAVDTWDPVTEEESYLEVMTGPTGCYIKAGQGLFVLDVDGTPVYRARNCDSNSYGISQLMYGLTPYPCRECPKGMVASSDRAAFPNSASHYEDHGDGTSGFVNVKACVTKAGHGYDSRIAQPCAPGTYNAQDTLSRCRACPYGYTTEGAGAGVTLADCKLAPGFGIYDGAVANCPIGTYADSLRNASSSTSSLSCTSCPTWTTTLQFGADSASDCQVCQAGYGGAACATPCGGEGTAASYGPPGRPLNAECVACAAATTGYSFIWDKSNDVFAPRPVAPAGAKASGECLAEF